MGILFHMNLQNKNISTLKKNPLSIGRYSYPRKIGPQGKLVSMTFMEPLLEHEYIPKIVMPISATFNMLIKLAPDHFSVKETFLFQGGFVKQ